LKKVKKIYFASDFHLGIDTAISSDVRENLIVEWLEHIKEDAAAIYLVGDVFDYWFEYKYSVPKGFFKLFAKLHNLIQAGVEIHYFKGNHDLWHFGYLDQEIGILMYDGPVVAQLNGKRFFVSHGDGLGPKDRKYKMIKSVMTNSFCQRLFSMLHPNIGLRIMRKMSNLSRDNHSPEPNAVIANAIPISFCIDYLTDDSTIDYFIFGHWHHPLVHLLPNEKSYYINLGDWMSHFTYGVWDGESFELQSFINK
jgi:UDP-2,3-diacylglucosamine hydrolase